MILVDANLLLYAYHQAATQHQRSKAWLEASLSGSELVRFAWPTVWAFLRIGTNARVFERPLSTSEAEAAVSSWFAQPNVGILEPGDRHWEILCGLMRAGQASGPLVMDAVLAAIALEHGAILCTTDRDFSRFPGLKCTNPIAPIADAEPQRRGTNAAGTPRSGRSGRAPIGYNPATTGA